VLFNSFQFIFIFMPSLLVIFYLNQKFKVVSGVNLMIGASVMFYSYYYPPYLLIILVSVLFNFGVGCLLERIKNGRKQLPQALMVFAISANLLALGYYKYFDFFASEMSRLIGLNPIFDAVALPLAISFFTFQQIGYLVDTYTGRQMHVDFARYALFILFFPQLIAGPICQARELIPQLAKLEHKRRFVANISVGLAVFSLGLFKKTILADSVSTYADAVFGVAETGAPIDFIAAWGGALSFTFQIYFDFSGYSEMALGLARCIGIRLPLNFFSPYKALDIIDFWRRWHITLSRFLRDHIYIPLGGNRVGQTRLMVNLMTVMVLGGIWHGAGYTFIIWGALHGVYLVTTHFYKSNFGQMRWTWLGPKTAMTWTFFLVVIAWIPFRSESFSGMIAIYQGMIGWNGVVLPSGLSRFSGAEALLALGFVQTDVIPIRELAEGWAWIAVCWVVVWFCPNISQIFRKASFIQTYSNRVASRIEFSFSGIWAIFIALTFFIGVVGMLSAQKEFLYFEF